MNTVFEEIAAIESLERSKGLFGNLDFSEDFLKHEATFLLFVGNHLSRSDYAKNVQDFWRPTQKMAIHNKDLIDKALSQKDPELRKSLLFALTIMTETGFESMYYNFIVDGLEAFADFGAKNPNPDVILAAFKLHIFSGWSVARDFLGVLVHAAAIDKSVRLSLAPSVRPAVINLTFDDIDTAILKSDFIEMFRHIDAYLETHKVS